MGCCVFINSKNLSTREDFEIIVPKSDNNKFKITSINTKYSYLETKNKEEDEKINQFPSSLIKSKDNPNGLVVIKIKN